jgi:hypothetical protein
VQERAAEQLANHQVHPTKGSGNHQGSVGKPQDLATLPTPAATHRSLSNLNGLSSFFPTPFLCNAILAEDLAFPLALILAGKAA